MRWIDMETWSRRAHFKFYRAFDHPFFSVCANVDVTAFYPAVKERGHSITIATVYVIARAANDIPEFRHRIRADRVVEHEVVHPSTTILAGEDLFSFCTFEYTEDFSEFDARAAGQIAHVQAHPTLENELGGDNLLFMTAIPWIAFTSFTHPTHLEGGDSVPRLAWGKFFEEGDALKMPLQVQVHHALMDGVHVGRFYTQVQAYLDDPEAFLGQGHASIHNACGHGRPA
jgi:chloramphenicol O-acetyltransferase type A